MKKAVTSRFERKIDHPAEREQIKREVNALYSYLSGLLGADKLILKAGKLEALALLRSRRPEEKVLGLQRVIFENPALAEVPALADVPELLQRLYDELAEKMARQAVEDTIERKIAAKMQEKQEEYVLEIKKQLLKEQGGPENPQTLRKYAELEKLRHKALNRTALEVLRPKRLE